MTSVCARLRPAARNLGLGSLYPVLVLAWLGCGALRAQWLAHLREAHWQRVRAQGAIPLKGTTCYTDGDAAAHDFTQNSTCCSHRVCAHSLHASKTRPKRYLRWSCTPGACLSSLARA